MGHMSIGEVLSQLRTEFPDVTISKIRYLESEGLLEPERTPSGYRKFSPGDVERLRYILTKQRDSYWPLRRIREDLDAIDRVGQLSEAGGRTGVPRMVLADDGSPTAESFRADTHQLRLSRAQMVQGAGISDELLTQIEQFGLVRSRGGGRYYDATALDIATTVGELAAYGLEPRHLRVFKTAADRETGLVQQIVSPLHRQRDVGATARALDTEHQLAALSVRLHTLLVKNGLRHQQ